MGYNDTLSFLKGKLMKKINKALKGRNARFVKKTIIVLAVAATVIVVSGLYKASKSVDLELVPNEAS